MKRPAKFGKYLAESVGTFFLVFAGTASIAANDVSRGAVTPLGIALVFGLVVLAMIYAVGHISGAHLNPAVTIGFFSAGRLPAFEVPRYWLAQLLGASLAALAVRFIFYHQATDIGVTLPSGLWWQSFLLEFVLTAILMFVIMGVTTDYRAQGLMAGVAIGATIAFEAILGGPISGASMNPARSFGPALITGIFRHHWIYWIAPLAGSMAGARLYLLTRCDPSADAGSQGCC